MLHTGLACRLARLVEPASDTCKVPVPRRGWQIVAQGPDAQQRRKQVSLCIRKREFNRLRWRRHTAVQETRIEIKKSGNESSAIVQHRGADQPGLKVDVN